MTYLDKIKSPDDLKKLNQNELSVLADEIRAFLVEHVMQTGGHLASNLGVVEMTIAILKTFNFPKDKLIFDVGHQCYVYKMLTGRLNDFENLRKFGGISGFPRTNESEYDAFDVGHASTSVSAALGMARVRDLKGSDENIIAVIGDGALTGGMSFEALNDVGMRKTKLIIILNDNEMSIQKNVGGLSAHLSKLRFAPKYVSTKNSVTDFLQNFGSFGKKTQSFLKAAKNKIKYATIASPLFEELGLRYIGIIDGNNTTELINALEKAKTINGPVLIHAMTKKGLGYEDAEKNPSKFHGINSLTTRINRTDMKYIEAFSCLINSLAEENEKIIAITAAMTSGCGLSTFAKNFPNRFFDVGIAEEHAVTMAAGMAKSGYVPVFSVYSTFLQRAYDQIVHDVCLQNLHVVFAIDHAGITGEDGETHQGLLDMSMLLHIPNMTVLAPSCYDEFKEMFMYAINECKGPVAIRYPKEQMSFRNSLEEFKVGKSELICDGNDVLIISCGRMTETALAVENKLKNDGISAAIINLRSVSPLDVSAIKRAADGKKLVVTLEDNIISGGAGHHIVSNIDFKCKKLCLGFETCFVQHGKPEELFELYGLDANSVYEKVLKEINTK